MSDADFDAHSEPDAGDDGLGALTEADGPWDLDAAPAGAAFLAFGPLSLPAIPGLAARLEYDTASGEVAGVTVRVADGSVQLQVVAARPGGDQWSATRNELLASLEGRAEHVEVLDGRFGPEVIAHLSLGDGNGGVVASTLRFQGIDGGAWLLRSVSSGPSVTDDGGTARVNAFLSNCAVDARGIEAIEAGTLIALGEPEEAGETL